MRISAGTRIVAAALGLAAGLSAQANVTSRAPAEAGTDDLTKIGLAYHRDDCDTVVRLGQPLVDSPAGAGLAGAEQVRALEFIADCERVKGLVADSYRHALLGARTEDPSSLLWRLRLGLELEAGRYEAAVATVEAMDGDRIARPPASDDPAEALAVSMTLDTGEILDEVPTGWMWRLHGALKDAGQTQARRRLLAVLASDRYDPDELYGPPDGFRVAYANMLLDSGDREGARSIVVGLKNPSILARASVDLRLRDLLPADVDIRAAAETELAVHRDAILQYPRLIAPIYEAAGNLRQLGRPAEALALLLAAAPRLDVPNGFTDRLDNLSWYWNALANSYLMLGRYDEGMATLAKGASTDEHGNPNISQLLNMAETQLLHGHPEDALRSVAAFDDPTRKRSPYGEMVLRFVRGCALATLGRAGEAQADLAFARAHERDNPGSLGNLLLCVGDLDGAAALLIRRLDDPDRRADALIQLSDYDDPPVASPPDRIESRLAALKARPDIKAAIKRAGGIRRFHVQAGEL
jgi:tetratricopeptide (TPR) repeat protein